MNTLLPDFPTIGLVIAIVIYVGLVALGLWLLWAIIRSAARRALRDHQLWLDQHHGR
jgi:hypothetical protein